MQEKLGRLFTLRSEALQSMQPWTEALSVDRNDLYDPDRPHLLLEDHRHTVCELKSFFLLK